MENFFGNDTEEMQLDNSEGRMSVSEPITPPAFPTGNFPDSLKQSPVKFQPVQPETMEEDPELNRFTFNMKPKAVVFDKETPDATDQIIEEDSQSDDPDESLTNTGDVQSKNEQEKEPSENSEESKLNESMQKRADLQARVKALLAEDAAIDSEQNAALMKILQKSVDI